MARKNRIIKYLQDSEVQKILSRIKNVRDKAIFTLMYYRGLRASEVGLLEVQNLRMDVGRMYVRRLKGSIEAEFLLSPQEIRVLRSWLEERDRPPWKGKGYVYSWGVCPQISESDDRRILFPSMRGNPIDRVTIYKLFRRYGEAVGIATDRLFPHTLKHSIATHLLEVGEDLTTVKDWLGHKSITSTEVYGKITNKRRDETSKRVYSKFGKTG